MVAVSGGLIFAGYQLLVYGWSQVNHGNAGFFDILWPGRYKGNPLDSGAAATWTSTGLNDASQGGTVQTAPTQASVNAAGKTLAGTTVFPSTNWNINPEAP
jgi:hypothetical protein